MLKGKITVTNRNWFEDKDKEEFVSRDIEIPNNTRAAIIVRVSFYFF